MSKLPILLLMAVSAIAQKKPITLETLYDNGRIGRTAPGPAVWAPDGKSFAFRQGRDLMIYDAAARSARMLASTGPIDAEAVSTDEDGPAEWENRRVTSATIQWTPDGTAILYAGGGDLFLIRTENGKWEQLTKTAAVEADPKLSPDGRLVAFRRDWDLYALDLVTSRETRLTTGGSATMRNGGLDWVYPEELDLGTAFWWSPDSKSIAYLQSDTHAQPLVPHADLLGERALYEPQRYPQAGENNADIHLGVVGASGGETRWLEIGDTRHSFLIARAGWMPDSRQVYIVRANRVQSRYDVLALDVETGATTALFQESDRNWVNIAGDLRFLRDSRRFLWTSERGGFRHIWLVSNDGKEAKQLTRGDWEVAGIQGVDEAGGRVFYTANEGEALERHLFSVDFNGRNKRRLSTEAGTHSISMAAETSPYYLDTYSSLSSPSRTLLCAVAGGEPAVYREADRSDLEQYDILPIEIVKFNGADGTTLHARLIKPPGFQAGRKYPVIVSVYGGPGVPSSIRNSWTPINMDQVYAHRGYLVWEAENRGITGHGHAFEAAIYRKLGAAELADQVAGVKHLIGMGIADPERIGVHGWSYGGFMTLNALLNAPDIFRCGAAGAPVTDWRNYDSIYTERYMGLPRDNPDGYRETALTSRAGSLKAKLLLLHNYEDDNVLFQNTMQMLNALQQAGKPFEFALYPQKTHGVTGTAARQMNATMLDFFERNLK